jgi:uncharacterized protein (DUF1501 family)
MRSRKARGELGNFWARVVVMTSKLSFTQTSNVVSSELHNHRTATMALVALGVFYGGVITGIPVVTGVAEGVQHQKEANAEAANETRMVKFYMDAFCDSDEINGMIVVLKYDKVYPSDFGRQP